MYSFRGPRSLEGRLKRASAMRGISQSGLILLALERELIRWEKEYAEIVEFQKKFEKQTGFPEEADSDDEKENE
jgi:hypothetical protein